MEANKERLWRVADFSDLPFSAVARALSRLKADGVVVRFSKGLYGLNRSGMFGDFLPNPRSVQKLVSQKNKLFPAGVAAANLLGFSTQTAKREELSTPSGSIPRKLIGNDAVIHTRRPEAWAGLTEREAALLDFLRRGGAASELSPEETVQRTLKLIKTLKAYSRLAKVAKTEPPRVRAILGALGEELNAERHTVAGLRETLNPLSKFDFGLFAALPNAKAWHAKGSSSK